MHHLANARWLVGAETTAQLVWILGPRLPEPEDSDTSYASDSVSPPSRDSSPRVSRRSPGDPSGSTSGSA